MAGTINAKALALAGGTTWATGVFLAGIGSMFIPGWTTMVNWLGQFYVGYSSSLTGSLTGAVWGFFDVFIGLYLFAFLYNWFGEKF